MTDSPKLFCNLDAESMLYRLSAGAKVDDNELEGVAKALEEISSDTTSLTTSIDDVYTYLLVLGKAKAEKYRKLFEQYLDCRDPFTVAFVLETLCLEWQQTETYFEYVVRYAVGVTWDEEEDVKLSAIKILGEYLREIFSRHVKLGKESLLDINQFNLNKSEQDVIELLLTTFLDTSTEHWTRQGAYCAMCRSAGKQWHELPSECSMLNFEKHSKDVDWQVVDLLQALSRSQKYTQPHSFLQKNE